MYLGKTIEELHHLLVNKEVTPLELTKEAIEALEKEKTNALETICKEEALEFAASLVEPEVDNVFWGIPYAAKDNFSTKGILTTASSEILKDYVPVFDATVISKLKEKKAVLIAKTTLDELAMGGTGTTSHKGVTYNPYDPSKKYRIGGSSCGSASICAQGIVPFSLGSDTGDSIRKPATFGGLVGFKPSWGRISRFGLFPFAPSLDHVGYFTRSVKDASLLLELLAGQDIEHDATSSPKVVEEYSKLLNKEVKGKKIAFIKEINDCIKEDCIKESLYSIKERLIKEGAVVEEVSFDEALLEAIYPAYMIISCAEATSNNANLDGIKFGPRPKEASTYQEVMMKARTAGFCELIKRRFVIGSYSLFKSNQEELFLRAQKIRRLIVNKANEIFKDYDVIITPCSNKVSQPIDSTSNDVSDRLDKKEIIGENHLGLANFGGFPSISIPVGINKEGYPYDINITGRIFEEANVLNIAYNIESHSSLKNLSTINKEVR